MGAILASLALIVMPNCGAVWMAAGLLWILDASINITMEPFRAFVGDMLPPSQRKSGFAMQSLLIGLGAVLSSASFSIAVFRGWPWCGFPRKPRAGGPIYIRAPWLRRFTC